MRANEKQPKQRAFSTGCRLQPVLKGFNTGCSLQPVLKAQFEHLDRARGSSSSFRASSSLRTTAAAKPWRIFRRRDDASSSAHVLSSAGPPSPPPRTARPCGGAPSLLRVPAPARDLAGRLLHHAAAPVSPPHRLSAALLRLLPRPLVPLPRERLHRAPRRPAVSSTVKQGKF